MSVIKYNKIGNIALVTDYVANGSFKTLRNNVQYVPSNQGFAKVIRSKDFRNNFQGPFRYVNKQSYNFLKKTKLFGGEIIISNVGNIGTVFRAPYNIGPMTLGPNSILVKTHYNDDYYYYFFLSDFGQKLLSQITSGSVQPKFNKTDFRNLKVPVPNINIQNKIANYLKSIDNKIALNKQISKNLLKLGNLYFIKLFSNNINHGPDKLKDFINTFNQKRLSLSKKKRSLIPGRFRYIGPTSVLGHINTYKYCGTYVLVARAGSVHDKNYHPVVQYVYGKFCANDDTCVMQGKKVSTEWLYFFFKNINIKGFLTGAVQQHFSQRNINIVPIVPPRKRDLERFQYIINPIFQQIKEHTKQNIILNKLKHDLLLKFFN